MSDDDVSGCGDGGAHNRTIEMRTVNVSGYLWLEINFRKLIRL